MAILNKIRKQSVVLIAVIALALFSFILADLFRNSDALSSKSQNVVATVNGHSIDRQEFMQKVENFQRAQGGRYTSTQAMNSVYEGELRNAILKTQFEALGLVPNGQQIKDQLAKNPSFQNEAGGFDEVKFNEYISNLKANSPQAFKQWLDYENNLANSVLQQDYINMVKAASTSTLSEGELQHILEGDKVNIKYVKVPYSSIKDDEVSISDDEVRTYMNARKKDFEVDASRNIKYVKFNEEASEADKQKIQNDLKKFISGNVVYNERTNRNDTIKPFSQIKNHEIYVSANSDIKFNDQFVFKSSLPSGGRDSIFNKKPGDVYGPYKNGDFYYLTKVVAETKMPDSVKARHILIPFIGSRSADSLSLPKEAAKQKADSLLKLFKRRKTKFADIAKEISADKGSGAKGGDLGYFRPGAMVPTFNDFCFEGKVGDVGVVESVFGYHIIDIQDQKNMQKAIKIATIGRKIEPSEATINQIFTDASNFELALKNGADFQAKADENKYEVRPVNTIKELDENLPGLGDQRQIVRWTFEKENEKGSIKRFNVPGGYAIVQLTDKKDKGLMSVEDAKVIAKPELLKEKKAKLIKEKIGSASSLQDVASSQNETVKTATAITMKNPVVSGSGKEPLVVGTAFGLESGQKSGLIAGDRGVYMIEVTKKEPAVKLDNYQSFANRIGREKLNAVNSRLYDALKDKAEIEDNRAKTVQ